MKTVTASSKSQVEALKWYLRAAEQGLDIAQIRAGVLYVKGEGVPKDFVKADTWFRILAANGSKTGADLAKALEKEMTAEDIGKATAAQVEFLRRKKAK